MTINLSKMHDLCELRETEWPRRGPAYDAFIEYMATLENDVKKLSHCEVEHKIKLSENKIFIFGSMKSGTSLLLNLLDGHPQLACLPIDAHLLRHHNLECESRDTSYHKIHNLWFRKLISPTGRSPFLVLGHELKNYVKFSGLLKGL